MVMTRTTALFAACLVSACTAPPVKPKAAMISEFDATAHAAYMKPGTAIVRGQGFLRQRGGGTVTCAGQQVVLVPATTFFREAFEVTKANGQAPDFTEEKRRPEYQAVVHRSQCDAQGNFSIPKVAPGRWFIATAVTWTVGYRRQGGMLLREIDVTTDADSPIFLTDKDMFAR